MHPAARVWPEKGKGGGWKGGKASCPGTPIRSVQDREKGGGWRFRIQRHLPMQVVQWTKSPSAGRFTIQLIDQCVQSKSVPSFIGGPLVNHHHHPPPHHTASRKSPPLPRRRRGASKKQKPSPPSPSRRFTGRAPCFVSRIRRPSSSSPSPPPPHLLSSLAAEVSSLFLGPACAVVPVYPTGRRDSLARRGRHSAMVCVCRCFPAGSHGDCRLYMCFGRDDGERVGYAILPAVVCMQTTWTVRSVDVARMGEYDF